jgi:hypothetical protein
MKRALPLKTIFIFIFSFIHYLIVAQTFHYADVIKSEGFDEALDIISDPDGYVYVAGQIEFDADFGNNYILESAGKHDIYLAKYNPQGNLVWAKRAGGKGGDKIHSIALDNLGHVYAVGEFEDTSYWDNIMKTTPGSGINNMFIAKYDTSGNAIWVKNISAGTGPLHTRGYGVTCDEFGNVYACGGTNGDAYFEGNYLFTTAGDYDGTIVKFDANGNFQWARRFGGTDSDKAYGIVSDQHGSVYVTGYFVGHADFSDHQSLTGHGHTDIFLAKYDASGLLQWVTQAGDTGFDRGHDIMINVNGEIIITGEFQTGYFGSHIAYSQGNEDMFLASYDSNGINQWVISGGSPEDDIGRGLSHDATGNIYVVGDYATTGNFPPLTITSNGFADVYIAKYNITGTSLDWIRSVGGHDNDRGQGISVDPAGDVFACGMFVDSARFDAINLIGDSLFDIFVAKLAAGSFCSTQIQTMSQPTCNGICNGSATAIPVGESPFSFSWNTSPPQTSDIASGLCAGNYTVTVTDNSGCISNATVAIIAPQAIQLSTTFSNAKCFQSCDGNASVIATGQAPFSYIWSTNPPQTSQSVSGICSGTYIITATDAAGCTSTASVTLTDPDAVNITSTITNASCDGCSDGVIDIHVAGGVTPYQYSWSNGSTHQDLHNLAAGSYSVCVNDNNNCMVCDTFLLTEPTTGIAEINSYGFNVFPNPLNGPGKISTQLSGLKTVNIYNSLGEIILRNNFWGNEFLFDAGGWQSGIYFIRVTTKEKEQGRLLSFLVN